MGHDFFNLFDQIPVINLPDREDRRSEFEEEMAGIGGAVGGQGISFFEAHRPSDAGTFPSIGALGCFTSHLNAIKQARDAGVGSLLILEDDAHFGRRFSRDAETVIAALQAVEWDIFYAGHRIDAPLSETPPLTELAPEIGVQTTHAVALSGRILAPFAEYLEAMKAREPGSPEGGPMHVDGAYSWFRAAHPDVKTFAATPEIITQRASDSDITPNSWANKLPFSGLIRRVRNKLS